MSGSTRSKPTQPPVATIFSRRECQFEQCGFGRMAAPAHSPTRPPNAIILWVAGWGSGPVPLRKSLLRDFSTRLSAADRFLHLREKARRFRAFLASFGLAERLEQFLLARVQPARRFDLDPPPDTAPTSEGRLVGNQLDRPVTPRGST